MDTLLLWDRELFLWLNGLGSETFDAFWMTITEKRYTIGFYAILTAVMGKWLGWKTHSGCYLLLHCSLRLLTK